MKAEHTFNDIEQVFNIPILIIHLVRNPFDMIATRGLIQIKTYLTLPSIGGILKLLKLQPPVEKIGSS